MSTLAQLGLTKQAESASCSAWSLEADWDPWDETNPCGVYKKTGHIVRVCGFEGAGIQSVVGMRRTSL